MLYHPTHLRSSINNAFALVIVASTTLFIYHLVINRY